MNAENRELKAQAEGKAAWVKPQLQRIAVNMTAAGTFTATFESCGQYQPSI